MKYMSLEYTFLGVVYISTCGCLHADTRERLSDRLISESNDDPNPRPPSLISGAFRWQGVGFV